MSDTIQAEYDQLEQVASRFMNQSQAIQQMLQQVRSSMSNLEGEWIGEGSESFFSEMEDEVMPASQRLQQALEEAGQVTKKIVEIVKQGEDEASSRFR
jgi:WXG100 family type VII secretion target